MVADRPVGTVVPADVIYDQQYSSMLQSAVLGREMATMIQQKDDGTEDGQLLARLCKLIFLIGKLPSEGPASTGLQASTDVLSDLLVEDLLSGSASCARRSRGCYKAWWIKVYSSELMKNTFCKHPKALNGKRI